MVAVVPCDEIAVSLASSEVGVGKEVEKGKERGNEISQLLSSLDLLY